MMEHRSFSDEVLTRRFSKGFFRRPRQVAALGSRADFELANAIFSPAALRLRGPAGDAAIEPRLMQVMVTLADANGAVVTRDRLMAECWDGLVVGDDAINRAISGIRSALRTTGAEIVIETVPKIGYRLRPEGDQKLQSPARATPRRALLFVGCGAALGAGGYGAWRVTTRPGDRQVPSLIERGRAALRDQLPDSTQQGIGFFEEALRIAPNNAEAWGNLALAWRNVSEYAPQDRISKAVAASEDAARRALALDPDQAQAHVALALLPPAYGDWLAAERRLRAVHAKFPKEVSVIGELAMLMFSVGRAREAADFSKQATELEPLSPIYQYRRVYHLWSTGRGSEAEQAVDRAMQLWPSHPGVWFSRFLLFAGTGRNEAALRMLAMPSAASVLGPLVTSWQMACQALVTGSSRDRASAITANVSKAREDGSACVSAILALNRLGALHETFMVAEGYLLRRGPLVTDIGSRIASINDQRWRKTMMLFVPATSLMRSDRRFDQLCEEIGLVRYWEASGTEPYFREAAQHDVA
jgi:DNA-binding winged helix-turn-helix (wHTH) protein